MVNTSTNISIYAHKYIHIYIYTHIYIHTFLEYLHIGNTHTQYWCCVCARASQRVHMHSLCRRFRCNRGYSRGSNQRHPQGSAASASKSNALQQLSPTPCPFRQFKPVQQIQNHPCLHNSFFIPCQVQLQSCTCGPCNCRGCLVSPAVVLTARRFPMQLFFW